MNFEWDENKNKINTTKHGVDFIEASSTFYDDKAILFDDPDHSVVDAQALLDAGILSKCRYGVKFLGMGEVTKKVTVQAAAFSETAKQKIEAAGGKAEVV